jgi:hypothetical protein
MNTPSDGSMARIVTLRLDINVFASVAFTAAKLLARSDNIFGGAPTPKKSPDCLDAVRTMTWRGAFTEERADVERKAARQSKLE